MKDIGQAALEAVAGGIVISKMANADKQNEGIILDAEEVHSVIRFLRTLTDTIQQERR